MARWEIQATTDEGLEKTIVIATSADDRRVSVRILAGNPVYVTPENAERARAALAKARAIVLEGGGG